MLSEVFRGLFVGSGNEVRDQLKDYKSPEEYGGPTIGVLNVADDYQEFAHHRDIFYAHAGLNDGPEDWEADWGSHNSPNAYLNAILMLDHMMFNFDVVFVHCHGGVSRSCFVIAIYLASTFGITYPNAKKLLKAAHSHEHIHPKHDDRAPHIMNALRDVPFISGMRMKDAAMLSWLKQMGLSDYVEGLMQSVKPTLTVIPGGKEDEV